MAQRARATLRRVEFASGIPVDGIELSPRMTRDERRALAFWIRRLPAGFAARLPRLKLAVADQLGSLQEQVFINEVRIFINEVPPEGARPLPDHLHAASFIPQRYVVLHRKLFRRRVELGRILYHELCHFLWPRLGNPLRQSYEAMLRREFRDGTRGELGYSAEWRKDQLRANPSRDRKGAGIFDPIRPALRDKRPGVSDPIRAARREKRAFGGSRRRARLWREYVCESFCDTAAYVLLGPERRARHSEYTLSRAAREQRCRWVARVFHPSRDREGAGNGE